MKVLVVNVGSTSVKYNLYEMDTEARLAVGKAERIGTPEASHIHDGGSVTNGERRLIDSTITGALRAILDHLTKEIGDQFRPPAILRSMVRAGKLGKKTGEGFYTWVDGQPVAK